MLQLFVAHNRDGEAIAKRLGVPFHKLPDVLPRLAVLGPEPRHGVWKERALWWPEPRGLIVAESIGTGPAYAVGPGPGGRAPVPARRCRPTSLRSFLPEHLLVGHGPPLHGGEAAAGAARRAQPFAPRHPDVRLEAAGHDPRMRSAG